MAFPALHGNLSESAQAIAGCDQRMLDGACLFHEIQRGNGVDPNMAIK